MKSLICTVLVLAGGALICWGFGLIYRPLWFIASGVAFLCLALLLVGPRKK